MNQTPSIVDLMRQCAEEQQNAPFFTIVPQDIINALILHHIDEERFLADIKRLPIMRNPRMREVMVFCVCNKSYIAYLPDDTCSRPIPDVPPDSLIVCPHCKASIHEWRSMSGHSGGSFNAQRHRSWTFAKGEWSAPHT